MSFIVEHVHRWVPAVKGEKRWHRCDMSECLAVADKEIPTSYGIVTLAMCHHLGCLEAAICLGDSGVWCNAHRGEDDGSAPRRKLSEGGNGCLKCFRPTDPTHIIWYAGNPEPESAARCEYCGITWHRFAGQLGRPVYLNLREKPPSMPMSDYVSNRLADEIICP